jgi:CubicO group peptidase (beta-lactamase class C family)
MTYRVRDMHYSGPMLMLMRLAFAFLLALPLHADLAADIDAFARRMLAETGTTPGLSVAVIDGDRVVHTGAFGLRDVEANAPVTPETLFYIASSTKPFTAAAVRLLAEDGKLDLDAPLTKSIPRLKLAPPLDASRISLRDLLAHRPGFANGAVNFRTSFPGNMDREAMFHAFETSSTPGPIEFGYSNTSYILASLAIEEAAGRPWHEVLATRIFAPLQMRSTFAVIPPATLPVAAGYVDEAHARFRRYAAKDARTMHAAGGMFSTAADLAKWMIEQMTGGRVFSRRVIRDLHAPQISLSRKYRNIDRHAYALGWYHGTYEGDADLLVHHFGGFNGFHAHLSFMPEHRIGVVVLSNGGGETADLLASFIYDRMRGKKDLAAKYDTALARLRDDAVKRRAEQEKAAARKHERRPLARPASAYAGQYTSDRLGTIVVREREGRLFAELGLIGNELLVEQGDAFVIDWLDDTTLQPVRFTFDEQGRATELDWDGRKFRK